MERVDYAELKSREDGWDFHGGPERTPSRVNAVARDAAVGNPHERCERDIHLMPETSVIDM